MNEASTPALAFALALKTLKSDIRSGVDLAIKKFSNTTGGLTPAGIEIRMVEVTAHKDHFRQHAIAAVDVDLGIQ